MKKTHLANGIPSSSIIQIETLRTDLMESIDALEQIAHTCCLHSPTDFTRNRKLPFKDVIRQILFFRNKSLTSELFGFYSDVSCPPTKSAFIQQRHKIRYQAFEFLFSHFMANRSFSSNMKGYRLLSCDGSTVNLLRNPDDTNTSVSAKPGAKSYNQLHVNAMYDLMNDVFISYKIDDGIHFHEQEALWELSAALDNPKNSIVVCDRGYGCFNSAAFMNSIGCHYIFRIKDLNSGYFMLTQLHLPDSEMDISLSFNLTSHHRKELIHNPDFLFLQPGSKFKFFDEDGMYFIKLRYLRFKLPSGDYESLITDLPEDGFSTEEIKEIYRMRWGIETSFRELKYAIDLVHFHSKQYNSVMQELIAKILMFNVCSLMVQCIPKKIRPDLKYSYIVNFTMAIGIIIDFIKNDFAINLNKLVYDMVPKRDGRSFPLGNLHDTKPAKSVNYRVS